MLAGALASRHTGALGEVAGRERGGRTLSPAQALGEKSPAIHPADPAYKLLVSCWGPNGPWMAAGCRVSLKENQTITKKTR